MSRHISLLVPGLLTPDPMVADPAATGQPDIAALEWLLTLAQRRPQPQTQVPDLLWQLAGQTGPVPVAALSYRHDFGALPAGPVLRADPVCLEADRDCVRLLCEGVPDLGLTEARQLIGDINEQFAAEPWQLVAGSARRWYLLLDAAAGIATRAPQAAVGGNIIDVMPTGERQSYWRGIINEIQMLMFNSPVNQQRQAAGRWPVNSLWLWGEGDASAPVSLPWVAVYSDDPVVAGLGCLAGLPPAPAPTSAQGLLEAAPPAGRILCQPVLEAGLPGLVAFNHDWALPLYRALQRGFSRSSAPHTVASVELLTANGVSYVTTAGKRWWRRRHRINRFLA